MREREKCSTPLKNFTFIEKPKNGNQINDRLTVQSNTIFEIIVKHSPQGGQHIQKEYGHQKTTPTKTVHRTVTQAAARMSQHGEQKQWQTTSTPKDKILTSTVWNKTNHKGCLCKHNTKLTTQPHPTVNKVNEPTTVGSRIRRRTGGLQQILYTRKLTVQEERSPDDELLESSKHVESE